MFSHCFELFCCYFTLHTFALLYQWFSGQSFLQLSWEIHKTFLDKEHIVLANTTQFDLSLIASEYTLL